ncbi:diaminopimelate decarboxylase [Thermococcus sp. AM4]|uniref:diaminopimelate decarboxylase n=1 Tax=Thermococcus sp. (strain AM4) TaxID=246969 RepID=UPI0001870737|nr:diaminopimelate decarboxylase [Thermococcus sp. AM4]EEB73023.1 Diaminopimelate decarboxylase [Thermococcus sp. AM4]
MWWEKPGHLRAVGNRLFIGEHDVVELAEKHGTPVYIYNLSRIRDNYLRMADALKKAGFREWRIHYAMKANNNKEVLGLIRELGGGIDATSPGEVKLAREIGFKDEDIIFTGTSLSNGDLEFLAKTNVLINFDSVSSLRRFNGEEGRKVGLRINTGVGIGRVEKTTTGGLEVGSIPVKFGISGKAIDRAFDLIEEKGLELHCLHHHVGSDWVGEKIARYFQALDNLLKVAEKAEARFGGSLKVIDLGGGYGVPHSAEEEEFPVYEFFQRVKEHMEEYGFGDLKVIVEPGTYLVSDAGILVAQVNTVEEKNGRIFVGVDAGLNVFNSPALYNYYHEIVVCNRVSSEEKMVATVVGNICESGDIFAVDRELPKIEEGDYIAILNAGAYGYVMANNYNLRPKGKEVVVGGPVRFPD